MSLGVNVMETQEANQEQVNPERMPPGRKVITTVLWGVLVLGMVGVIGTGLWARQDGGPAVNLPVLFEAAPFALTNQNGQPVTHEDLRGRVWVAAFIFTNCPGICPMMTGRMSAMQETIDDESVKLVSFTLDPDRDTEAVLKEYAARIGADENRWQFLRGEEATMYELAGAMKLAATPLPDKSDIMHSDRLILIDELGRIRGYYSTRDEEKMRQLAMDAAALAEAARRNAP